MMLISKIKNVNQSYHLLTVFSLFLSSACLVDFAGRCDIAHMEWGKTI